MESSNSVQGLSKLSLNKPAPIFTSKKLLPNTINKNRKLRKSSHKKLGDGDTHELPIKKNYY